MVKSERVGDVFLFLLSYTCWKELSGMPYVEMGWGRRGSVT